MNDSELLSSARELMRTEANEILRASERINLEIVSAAKLIYECSGRVVVVGLGKSGHVGRKISATLASLGTPSFFLHAAEASHGDLGMVRPEDVGLFISNSGSSSELVALLPHFRRLGAKMIAITGSPDSPLANYADIILNAHVNTEGDPLQLAPMSSTTLELVMGDALSALVTIMRGLKREDFALYHPGGALGRKLLTRVRDVMNENVPAVKVNQNVSVKEALFVITGGGYGAACILDEDNSLVGIFTDGDLRRLMEKKGSEAFNVRIEEAMTRQPRTISPDSLAAQAVKIMEQNEISVLIAIDGNNKPVGIIHIHELLKAGVA